MIPTLTKVSLPIITVLFEVKSTIVILMLVRIKLIIMPPRKIKDATKYRFRWYTFTSPTSTLQVIKLNFGLENSGKPSEIKYIIR